MQTQFALSSLKVVTIRSLPCEGHDARFPPLRLYGRPRLLPREGEFALRVTLLQSGYLAVLHDELPNVIRELRRPELEPLDGDQLLGRSARKGERETSAGLVEHLKFDLGRSDVVSRQFFEQRRVQRFGLAREHDFALIQRDHRAIDVSLRVRPKV